MAQIDEQMLNAAYEDGWFERPLTERHRLYLRPSVVTIHDLLTLLKAAIDGLSIEQMANRSHLNTETCRQLARWMVAAHLISVRSEPVELGKPAQRKVYYFN